MSEEMFDGLVALAAARKMDVAVVVGTWSDMQLLGSAGGQLAVLGRALRLTGGTR